MKQNRMALFLFLLLLFQVPYADIPDTLVWMRENQEDTRNQELEEAQIEKQPVLVKETGEKVHKNGRTRRALGKLRIPFGEVPEKQQIYSRKTIADWKETKPKKQETALQAQNRRAPPFAEWEKQEQTHTA